MEYNVDVFVAMSGVVWHRIEFSCFSAQTEVLKVVVTPSIIMVYTLKYSPIKNSILSLIVGYDSAGLLILEMGPITVAIMPGYGVTEQARNLTCLLVCIQLAIYITRISGPFGPFNSSSCRGLARSAHSYAHKKVIYITRWVLVNFVVCLFDCLIDCLIV